MRSTRRFLLVSVGTLDMMGPSILRRVHQIDDGCLRVALDFGLVSKDWSPQCVEVHVFEIVKKYEYTSIPGGRPLCHGPLQTLKMKKCKAKPSSFSKSKAGFSRVFAVPPKFIFSCEKP